MNKAMRQGKSSGGIGRILKEQNARLYIIRRCVVMLLSHHDWLAHCFFLESGATIFVLDFISRMYESLPESVKSPIMSDSKNSFVYIVYWVIHSMTIGPLALCLCWHSSSVFDRSWMQYILFHLKQLCNDWRIGDVLLNFSIHQLYEC